MALKFLLRFEYIVAVMTLDPYISNRLNFRCVISC